MTAQQVAGAAHHHHRHNRYLPHRKKREGDQDAHHHSEHVRHLEHRLRLRREEQRVKRRRTERFRNIWLTIIIMATVYNVIDSSRRIGFFLPAEKSVAIFDLCLEIVYLIDIYIQCNFSFDREGMPLPDIKTIRKRYIRGWLWPDLISILPLDVVGIVLSHRETDFMRIQEDKYDYQQLLHPLFRLNKLVRILRLPKYFNQLVDNTPLQHMPTIVRIMQYILFMLFWVHIHACIYFCIVYVEGEEASLEWTDAIFPGAFPLQEEFVGQYARSCYMVLASMTGYSNNYGKTDVETVFSLYIIVTGVAMLAVVVAAVMGLVEDLDRQANLWREKLTELNGAMDYLRVPTDLQNEVRAYHDYMWRTRKTLDEQNILDDLPEDYQRQISVAVNTDIVKRVPVFHAGVDDEDFVEDIVAALRPHIALPGSTVVTKGDKGDEMYFLTHGIMRGFDSDKEEGEALFTLREGMFFGEISLLFGQTRSATIVADSFCDLYILTRQSFEEIGQRYPAIFAKIAMEGRYRSLELQTAWAAQQETKSQHSKASQLGGPAMQLTDTVLCLYNHSMQRRLTNSSHNSKRRRRKAPPPNTKPNTWSLSIAPGWLDDDASFFSGAPSTASDTTQPEAVPTAEDEAAIAQLEGEIAELAAQLREADDELCGLRQDMAGLVCHSDMMVSPIISVTSPTTTPMASSVHARVHRAAFRASPSGHLAVVGYHPPIAASVKFAPPPLTPLSADENGSSQGSPQHRSRGSTAGSPSAGSSSSSPKSTTSPAVVRARERLRAAVLGEKRHVSILTPTAASSTTTSGSPTRGFSEGHSKPHSPTTRPKRPSTRRVRSGSSLAPANQRASSSGIQLPSGNADDGVATASLSDNSAAVTSPSEGDIGGTPRANSNLPRMPADIKRTSSFEADVAAVTGIGMHDHHQHSDTHAHHHSSQSSLSSPKRPSQNATTHAQPMPVSSSPASAPTLSPQPQSPQRRPARLEPLQPQQNQTQQNVGMSTSPSIPQPQASPSDTQEVEAPFLGGAPSKDRGSGVRRSVPPLSHPSLFGGGSPVSLISGTQPAAQPSSMPDSAEDPQPL